MTKKSAESYVPLKGNDKAISILQNVIKVIVITPTQTPILYMYYFAFMVPNICE